MSCELTGFPCATWLITFSAEKFGTTYAAAVANHWEIPWVSLANPRRSSAKLPITKSENANTAESSGEEKDEKNNASAVMITNCSTMKYSATTTEASEA